MRAGRTVTDKNGQRRLNEPPHFTGDDTDRPGPRDDFRRSVTPLYPSEGAHETVRPNFQVVLPTHPGCFKSEFHPLRRDIGDKNCKYCQSLTFDRRDCGHIEIAISWKNMATGRFRSIRITAVNAKAEGGTKRQPGTDNDGPHPVQVAAHRIELIKKSVPDAPTGGRLSPSEPASRSAAGLSDRFQRPARHLRHD